MPRLNWNQCCSSAIERIRTCEQFTHVDRPNTIGGWHHKFRTQQESFVNPAFVRAAGKPLLPPFLARNEDAKNAIVKHGLDNLTKLSSESLHSYIHDEVLPALATMRTAELKEQLRARKKEHETNNTSDNDWCVPLLSDKDITEANVTVEDGRWSMNFDCYMSTMFDTTSLNVILLNRMW